MCLTAPAMTARTTLTTRGWWPSGGAPRCRGKWVLREHVRGFFPFLACFLCPLAPSPPQPRFVLAFFTSLDRPVLAALQKGSDCPLHCPLRVCAQWRGTKRTRTTGRSSWCRRPCCLIRTLPLSARGEREGIGRAGRKGGGAREGSADCARSLFLR